MKGLIFIALGIYIIVRTAADGDAFIDSPRRKWIVDRFGRSGARMVNIGLALFMIVGGLVIIGLGS